MARTQQMIDDLIVLETNRDREWVKTMVKLNQFDRVVGESAMLHHLRDLKNLVEIEFRQATTLPATPPVPDTIHICKCGREK